MTSTITITHPNGIVLGADRLVKYPIVDLRIAADKIYFSAKTHVGISFWGTCFWERGDYEARASDKCIGSFLKSFDNEDLDSDDTVDKVASKLKTKLETFSPEIRKGERCGFHVAGYLESKPKLRHVFHEKWHEAEDFSNENCHKEYHTPPDGDRVERRYEEEFPVLFNGDNFIANVLINIARSIKYDVRIVPKLLSLNECIELAALVISTSINRLDYYVDLSKYQKIDPDVGKGGNILAIQEDSKQWYEINPVPISQILTKKE